MKYEFRPGDIDYPGLTRISTEYDRDLFDEGDEGRIDLFFAPAISERELHTFLLYLQTNGIDATVQEHSSTYDDEAIQLTDSRLEFSKFIIQIPIQQYSNAYETLNRAGLIPDDDKVKKRFEDDIQNWKTEVKEYNSQAEDNTFIIQQSDFTHFQKNTYKSHLADCMFGDILDALKDKDRQRLIAPIMIKALNDCSYKPERDELLNETAESTCLKEALKQLHHSYRALTSYGNDTNLKSLYGSLESELDSEDESLSPDQVQESFMPAMMANRYFVTQEFANNLNTSEFSPIFANDPHTKISLMLALRLGIAGNEAMMQNGFEFFDNLLNPEHDNLPNLFTQYFFKGLLTDITSTPNLKLEDIDETKLPDYQQLWLADLKRSKTPRANTQLLDQIEQGLLILSDHTTDENVSEEITAQLRLLKEACEDIVKLNHLTEQEAHTLLGALQSTDELIKNPSAKTLEAFTETAHHLMQQPNWGKVIGGIMLTIGTLVLASLALTVTIASAGATAPLALFGTVFAPSTLAAVVSGIATTAGLGGAAYGGKLIYDGATTEVAKPIDQTKSNQTKRPEPTRDTEHQAEMLNKIEHNITTIRSLAS